MSLSDDIKSVLWRPAVALQRRVNGISRQMRGFRRGFAHWRSSADWSANPPAFEQLPPTSNALQDFFDARKTGRGIWKYTHYFDIYERHFSRFRGREVNVLEIGVYSGGSLEMWRDYFGPRCRIYGVDIQPACKAYESDSVKIFIGDQGDRKFWRDFKRQVPNLDIVIDDGSHLPEHQIVTFEELLPHLRRGGVYLCEDVTQTLNPFAAYVAGFGASLNSFDPVFDLDNLERRTASSATPFQSAIAAVHLYPYVVVVERTSAPVAEFVSPKHGTQWQPFLKADSGILVNDDTGADL